MNNKVQNILLGVLAVGLIGLTVAYAALSQTLKITGTATVASQNWDVHFDNLVASTPVGYAELDATSSKLAIQEDTTIISGNLGTLKAPGDSITYTFDIVNTGDINAELSAEPTISTPTCTSTTESVAAAVCENLEYTITYSDGTAIAQGDKLDAKATKSAKLTVTYKGSATTVASEDVSVDAIDAVFTYGQAD